MQNDRRALAATVGAGYRHQIVMRPDILNPLFAEVEALKGVGPALAKPLERLGIARVLDLLFHLPSGWVDRWPRDELMQGDVGRTIAITLTQSVSSRDCLFCIAQGSASHDASSSRLDDIRRVGQMRDLTM